MATWPPVLNEELVLKRELTNARDSNAVVVLKDDSIVGHAPFNLTHVISVFLRKGHKLWICKVYLARK